MSGEPTGGVRWQTATTNSRVATTAVAACAEPVMSVIVVTYGTGQIIERCLAALEHTLRTIPHEIVVVDNAAPGGMPAWLRLRLVTSGVTLIRAATNLGFGGGNEVGIAHARGDVLCLVNPDVVVQPGWAEPLLTALADPGIGIAAPLLLDPDGSVQEAGHTIDRRAVTRPNTLPPSGEIDDVAYSSAACWTMRRAVHAEVGGFDAAYHPAYFEDVDLALRTRRAGYRTVLVGSSSVVHHAGSSTRERPRPARAQQEILRRRWAPYLRELAAAGTRSAEPASMPIASSSRSA